MLKLFLRLHALKDWLSDRTKRTTPHRFGRVGGVFVSLVFSFLIPAITYAQAPGASASALSGLNAQDTIVSTLADLAYAIAGILTQGIVLMIDLMVPIMTYNSFVTNPVVSAGWAIMRDTINMFFVIVLIIIAFGTIFGHSKFQWSQQVPKLLTFAIVINFSKTLCGIMIDFGQVIMLTFANALREIAAGNFIQLLGLDQLYSASTNIAALDPVKSAAGANIGSFDYLGGGVMSVLLTMWVLGTLIMLVVILGYRIVGLWILVVISPLAWFVGGVGGSSGFIQSDAYATWWNRFKCLVGVGPVLTFFLWLTLAVAGAGNIAAKSGFEVSSANSANLASKLLEPAHFMSFLIGMFMLFAGFDAAQQLCSSLSGTQFGKALKSTTSGALQKGAVALGLKGAGKGLSVGSRAIRRAPDVAVTVASYLPGSAAVSAVYGRARESVKTGIGGATQQLGKVTGLRTLERAGVSYKAKAKAQGGISRTEDMKMAKDAMKGKSREEKLDLMKAYANQVAKDPVMGLSTKEDAQYKALLDEAMGDKRMQKEARATGLLQAAWKQKGDAFQKDHAHDAAKLDQINDFKKANADITKSSGLISDWDDAKGLNDDALKDTDVKARLGQVKSTVRGLDGEYMSAFDAIEQGHAGAAKQKALVTVEEERYERMNDQELARVSVQTLTEGTKDEKGSVVVRAATSDGLKRAIETSMRTGDEGRARTLMSHLGARVQSGETPVERAQAYSAMQGAAGSVGNMARSAGTTDLFKRVKRAAEETVRRRVREENEALTRPLRTPSATEGVPSPSPVVVEQTEDAASETLVAEQTADSEAATVIAEQQADSASQTIVPPRT